MGSWYFGQRTGTHGVLCVFAFFPFKQLSSREGGMVVSNSSRLIQLVKSLRNQGRNINNNWLTHVRLGYNYRMDEMSAALGLSQLNKLDWMIQQKAEIADWYNAAFQNMTKIIAPTVAPGRTHSWFVYVIRVPAKSRNKLIAQLASQGIQTKPYLPVIHLQPFMKKMFGFKKGDFPIAETVASQTIALPFYIGLKKRDIAQIANSIKEIL